MSIKRIKTFVSMYGSALEVLGKQLELSKDALNNFRNNNLETPVEIEVDTETGDMRFVSINGAKVGWRKKSAKKAST